MEKEKISVLIPAYNVEKYIARCIKSILKQTYSNLEIIIVNDGSTDKTNDIVSRFAEKDSRIKLYQKENTKSLADTRNYLLSKVTCKYFVFVDSDDYIDKHYVEQLYKNLINTNTDLCGCGFMINYFTFPSLLAFSTKKKLYSKEENLKALILAKTIHFTVWNKIYKTELAKDIVFDKNINYGEDLLFCLEYIAKCKNIYYFNRPLYHYTIRRNNITHEKFGQQHINFLNRLEEKRNCCSVETDKQVLQSWIAFSSLFFLHLIKKSNYTNIEFKQKLIDNYKMYNKCFKTTDKSLIFTIGYNFLKHKNKKDIS